MLVIANETVTAERLREEIRQAASGYRAEVLVVCPALNSPLRHWASDEDEARAAAQKRLDESLRRLRGVGIEARGEIGNSDPLQAIEDALRRSPVRAPLGGMPRRASPAEDQLQQ